jgi:magnesium transporter
MQSPYPYWIDVDNPVLPVLQEMAEKCKLHHSSIQDCLDPEHYPKIEKIEDTLFIILRFKDEHAQENADELLTMTRKMSFFLKDYTLITVHRDNPKFLTDLISKLSPNPQDKTPHLALMTRLMKACIESYSPYLEKIELQINGLERELIQRKMHAEDLIKLYQYRSRLSVVKRLLWHSQAVIKELLTVHIVKPNPWMHDLQDTTQGMYQYVDEMMEDTQNLLNLHISLSSQKTNEVVRFLTVVSLFFLPLTFIVGIYGMNFDYMPELKSPWGYPICWAVMVGTSYYIYRKVKKRGWLDQG